MEVGAGWKHQQLRYVNITHKLIWPQTSHLMLESEKNTTKVASKNTKIQMENTKYCIKTLSADNPLTAVLTSGAHHELCACGVPS